MESDDPVSFHPIIRDWADRLAHPVILPVALAVLVGLFAHSIVFAELTGLVPLDLDTIPIGAETTHFAWFCTGCGLALMFAAFAMLR